MQNLNYQEALIEAVKTLHAVEIKVFTAMVNVGFTGPYEEISNLHEVGEVLNLEVAMFENTGDANLDVLTGLVKQISGIKRRLINLNALKVELED
jgi:hypothetical protein